MKNEIEILQNKADQISEQITYFEIDEWDYTEQFDNMLDECYEGPFNILPSKILSECDPIQYRCWLSDYVSGIDLDEVYEYNELVIELEDLETQIEDLNELLENETT
jgi:hypothetical protein